MQKNYILVFAWLQIVTACGSAWEIQKVSRAVPGIWTTDVHSSLMETGHRNCTQFWNLPGTWTKLTLFCFIDITMWSFGSGARKKSLERAKLAFFCVASGRASNLSLQTDVCLEGKGNLSLQKLMESLTFVLMLIAHLAMVPFIGLYLHAYEWT